MKLTHWMLVIACSLHMAPAAGQSSGGSAYAQLKARAQPLDGQSLALLRLRDGPVTDEVRQRLAGDVVGAELRNSREVENWREAEEFQRARGGKVAEEHRIAIVEWSRYKSTQASATRFLRYLLKLDSWEKAFPDAPGARRAALVLAPSSYIGRPVEFAQHDAESVITELLPHLIRVGAPDRLYVTAMLPSLRYDFAGKAFVNDSNREKEMGRFLPRPRVKSPMFVDPGTVTKYRSWVVPRRAEGFALYETDGQQEGDRGWQGQRDDGIRELAWSPDVRNAVRVPRVLALDRDVSLDRIPVEPRLAEVQAKATRPGKYQGEGWLLVVELSQPKVEVVRYQEERAGETGEFSTLFARVERVLVLGPSDDVVLDLPPEKFPLASASNALAAPPASSKAAFPASMPLNHVLADLLIAKFVPDAVTGDLLKGMFASRLAYEQSEDKPLGGRFFNASGRAPNRTNLEPALAEFRRSLLAATRAMPAKIAVTSEVHYGQVQSRWLAGGGPGGGCATVDESTSSYSGGLNERMNTLTAMKGDAAPADKVRDVIHFEIKHLLSELPTRECLGSDAQFERMRRGGSVDLGSGYIELPLSRVATAIYLASPVQPPATPPEYAKQMTGGWRKICATMLVEVTAGRALDRSARRMLEDGEFPFRFEARAVETKWSGECEKPKRP